MRPLAALGLLLASACTPAEPGPTFGSVGIPHDPMTWLQPNFAELPEECFTDEFYMWLHFWQNPDGTESQPTWDHPCVDALQRHMGLVQESCYWSEEYGGVNGYIGGCSGELAALLLLARGEFGLVENVDQGASSLHDTYVHAPLIQMVRQVGAAQGHDEVGPALYDFVTSTITSVAEEPTPYDELDVSAQIDIDTRELTVFEHNIEYERLMATFVHEAAHAWLQKLHVDCTKNFVPDFMGDVVEVGSRSCDDDWNGAWGFGGGAAWLAFEYGQDEVYLSTDNLWAETFASRCFINSEPCDPYWDD